MAIEEEKREDLLRDAVTYTRRLMLRIALPLEDYHEKQAQGSQPRAELFAGCRADGCWSLYFGEDPVLQFTQLGRVRRLYVDGRKYAFLGGSLTELTRMARGGRVQLTHQADDSEREISLRQQCHRVLQLALNAIEASNVELVGKFPGNDERIMPDLRSFLQRLGASIPDFGDS